jgi:hypothetical protein
MNSYGFVNFLILSQASADISICFLNFDKKSNNECDIYEFLGYMGDTVVLALLSSFDDSNEKEIFL